MEIFKSGVDLLQLGVTAMGGGAVLMGIQRRNAISDQCGAGLRADGLRKCRSAV